MRLLLNDQVHAALLDSDFVLLDVAADTYFCLPAGQQSLSLNGRWLEAEPEVLAEALCDASLAHRAPLQATEAQTPPLIGPARSARAALDASPALKAAKIHPRHLWALARAVFRRGRARGRSFGERLKPAPTSEPRLSDVLLRDLAVFRRLSPWFPIDGACLSRSELLRAYLRALGHDATWMFGVRTWPFRAHCWLQVQDMALDDEAERLSAFVPIMAV